MKKYLILLPAIFVAGLAMSRDLWQHSHDHDESCGECDAPKAVVEADSVEIFPDTSSGVEVTIDYKMPDDPDAQRRRAVFFHNASGTFHGRFHYWLEADGGRRLYLYDATNHMVGRLENPEWVRVRK